MNHRKNTKRRKINEIKRLTHVYETSRNHRKRKNAKIKLKRLIRNL